MKRLPLPQVAVLRRLLTEAMTGQALLPELLDHLVCEAEERLWNGESFEEVIALMRREITPVVVCELNQNRYNLLAMNASLNEIVFEGRNKAYGAYALRSYYPRNVGAALFLALTVFTGLVFLPRLFAVLSPKVEKERVVVVAPVDVTFERKEQEYVAPPQPKEMPVQKQVRYVAPVVVTEVLEETPPPTIESLENAQISNRNVEGEDFREDIILPPSEISGPSKGEAIGLKSAVEEEFIHVEQQPEFRGGMEAFRKFLEKNLKYPSRASGAGVQGRVFVQFSVMADGTIANVEVVKGIGFGCDEEAARVVKLMPPWAPGKQGGKPVRVRFTLPIQFSLAE